MYRVQEVASLQDEVQQGLELLAGQQLYEYGTVQERVQQELQVLPCQQLYEYGTVQNKVQEGLQLLGGQGTAGVAAHVTTGYSSTVAV